jgi:hypothetical protein
MFTKIFSVRNTDKIYEINNQLIKQPINFLREAESLISRESLSWSRNSSPSLELENSLLCSQEPVAGHHAEPVKSSPYPHNVLIYVSHLVNLISLSHS